MKQLDFSGIDVVRTAERERRHDAFWGPLNETRRTTARVACDFFAFVGEVDWQLAQHSRLAASDPSATAERKAVRDDIPHGPEAHPQERS